MSDQEGSSSRESSSRVIQSVSCQKNSRGRVFGAILLIAGCCIGTGMLGLPVVSALSGFIPSLVMFLIGWLFMLSTGLLLLEINLWYPEETNIVSMANRLLGPIGKGVAWGGFLFLFYTIILSYISGCGDLLKDFLFKTGGWNLPSWIGSVICTAVLSLMLYWGTRAADYFNRLLMLGLILCYIALVVIGIPHIHLDLLTYSNWDYSPAVLPLVIISFGFHNLVPSLVTYLKRDAYPLRLAIIIGSMIPLFVYIVWEFLILGLVPVEGANGLKATFEQGQMATHALQFVTQNQMVTIAAQLFAFFAITTSFIGVALSFIDFLADGLSIKKTTKGKFALCCLVLLPPLFFAINYPDIFLYALGYAGGVGAVLLFGLLPALMTWSGRYRKKIIAPEIVPGGKAVLLLIMSFSMAMMFYQMFMSK